MGIEAIAAMTIVQGLTGLSAAKRASKATKDAQRSAEGGPQRGLDTFFDLEDRLGGVPDISGGFVGSEFRTLSDEDYDELERSIFESRTALYKEPFEESLRSIQGEEERRGISSLGAEQRYRLAGRTADMLRAEAADASGQRYGLQLQEQGQLNQLGQQEAGRETAFNLKPLDIFFNRASLGGQFAGIGANAGANAGQARLQGFGQQADIIGGTMGGISNMFGQASAYNLLNPGVNPTNNQTLDLRDQGFSGR